MSGKESPARTEDASAQDRGNLALAKALTNTLRGVDYRVALETARAESPVHHAYLSDVIERLPSRAPGRPSDRPSLHRAVVEIGIERSYTDWWVRFRYRHCKRDRKGDRKRDYRKSAWHRAEVLRLLRAGVPLALDADGNVSDDDLEAAGAERFPDLLGVNKSTPSNLALAVVVQQYAEPWEQATGRGLTPSSVRKIVTRVRRKA